MFVQRRRTDDADGKLWKLIIFPRERHIDGNRVERFGLLNSASRGSSILFIYIYRIAMSGGPRGNNNNWFAGWTDVISRTKGVKYTQTVCRLSDSGAAGDPESWLPANRKWTGASYCTAVAEHRRRTITIHVHIPYVSVGRRSFLVSLRASGTSPMNRTVQLVEIPSPPRLPATKRIFYTRVTTRLDTGENENSNDNNAKDLEARTRRRFPNIRVIRVERVYSIRTYTSRKYWSSRTTTDAMRQIVRVGS